MRKVLLFIQTAVFMIPLVLFGQETKPDFGIKFSGFVKNDFSMIQDKQPLQEKVMFYYIP